VSEGSKELETKIETTRRSTGRLNVIEEDSNFSEAPEEVDSESEEDSHGATDEKPREIRREKTPYSRGGRQI
jgi:hypothetical protein